MEQNKAIASLHASLGLGQRKVRPSPAAKRKEIQTGQVVVLERVLSEIRKRVRVTPAWANAYNSAATVVELELAAIRGDAKQCPPAPVVAEGEVITDLDGQIHWMRDGHHVVTRPYYGAERALMRQRDAALKTAQAKPAPQPVELSDWAECQRISDVPDVDEALRGFQEDPTGDNATCVVRAILAAKGEE